MKLRFLAGLGAGYVLGTRAGRAQYDRMVQAVNSSEVFRQARDELGKLRGSASQNSAPATSCGHGLVSPPVTFGPGPQGSTSTDSDSLDMTGDVVPPDLEPTTSAQDTAEAGESQRAKRITPPAAS